MARVDGGAFDDGVADLRHAIELGQKYADPHLALAFNVLIMALHECGRDEQALDVFRESVEFERRSGAVVAPPPVLYAFLALGRWDEGIGVAEAQVAGYGRFGVPTTPQGLAMAGLGHFLLRKGRYREARVQFDAALQRVRHVRDIAWLANTLWGLACCALAAGLGPEARSYYVQCIERWATTEDRGTIVPILLDAVLFAVRNGYLEDATAWSRALSAISEHGNPVARAATLLAHGAVSLAHGRVAEASDHLHQAVPAWGAVARPYETARARCHLAEALLHGNVDANRRREADEQLRLAGQIFADLGAQADAAATADMRRRAGLLGREERRHTVEATKALTAGLTPRELDVLRCLVDGRTNKEISALLFIAESTAELHVSRVLGKLGCSTRAQAAALAVSLGLASPSTS
jgi:DNA-binding CsgD family transcriptional regulator